MSEAVRVGVIGGTRLPGNVNSFLANVRRLLVDHPARFELELVVDGTVDSPDGFDQVDPGMDDSDRGIETLVTLVGGITRYAKTRDIDLLWQVTKFPLHGCAATVAGRRTDTPVLARLAGDNFREFRVSSGLHAIKAFGLNNVFGRVPTRLGDRIIVLGPYGRKVIERYNDDVSTIEIPQPVDRDRFFPVSTHRERELAAELDFPADEHVLLTVGRLTYRKGMETVIRAAEKLAERRESTRWYVLGDGPMRDRLIETPGVEPRGRVDFDRMPDYYRAADLVVHPSRIEGLPNVLLEAAACGTPTVARDVGDSQLVASTTFSDDGRLPELVSETHDPVALGDRFSDDHLRGRYATAIVETARQ